jgi:hypothetical protein
MSRSAEIRITMFPEEENFLCLHYIATGGRLYFVAAIHRDAVSDLFGSEALATVQKRWKAGKRPIPARLTLEIE